MASGLIVVQQYPRMVVQRLGTFVGVRRPGLSAAVVNYTKRAVENVTPCQIVGPVFPF
jgi:hypothetical protein